MHDPPARIPVESVRFSLERELLAQIEALPDFDRLRRDVVPSDPTLIRRRLLAEALRLTPTMAPSAYALASGAAKALGVSGELEIYQSSGRENAALHLAEQPILLEIQGRLLSLLDEGSGLALFGHELGHHLAHGPWTDVGRTQVAAIVLAERGLLPSSSVALVGRMFAAREVTADRFGLLACGSLEAALRLEMIATTGLSGDAITWDTSAYLAQCRELMESVLARGEQALAGTHPEHSLRAWAGWLFSETDVFRRLTGQGSGTRRLGEVDALVAKALGDAGVAHQEDLRSEPPPFLSECALASAVLVASADGELAPQELDAIENAFGRTVPGWAEVLDPEVALERFYETGAVVRSAGPDLVRRLFLLLTHVMGADDVVDAREVQMVLAIGEALGYAAEFRRWIRPAVEAMGTPLGVELEHTVALPLPVRRNEIKAALEAFCESIERCGEARVAPRRILRIAGSHGDDVAVLERVKKVLDDRGIACEPDLQTAPLDAPVRLVATRPRARAADERVVLEASRAAVIGALTRLRDELVSGDGRSPSVRLRRIVASRHFDLTRLDGVRVGAAERALAMLQSKRTVALVTADDAGKHDVARTCANELRLLDRTIADRKEETGANDLYLGYPLVYGTVAPQGQTRGGYAVRGPLILYPVELQRDGRGSRGFDLAPRPGEDPLANQSLIRLLFNKAGLALPDELGRELDEIAADAGRGLEALLGKLREVGLPIGRESDALQPFAEREDLDDRPPFLAVEERAVLGLFPQSNSDLLGDYDSLLRELAQPEVSVAERLAAARALLPSYLALQEDAPSEESVAGFDRPVVEADPSQRAVAAACRQNCVTVVDGPPGTGKSQLIVNLVADALRRGERVAVVAEKRAALDVVHQRLEARGLGAPVAVVHDVNDDRKALFGRIRERLEGPEPPAFSTARLDATRKASSDAAGALERNAVLLQTRLDGIDLTVGQLVSLTTSGTSVVDEPGLAALDREGLERLLELAERLWPTRDLWGPDSWWRTRGGAPRGSLADIDDTQLARLRAELAAALPLVEAFEACVRLAPIPHGQLLGAREVLDAVHAAGTEAEAVRILHALVAQGDCGVEELAQSWAQASIALTKWSTPLAPASEDALRRAVLVLCSHAGRFSRVFSPLWWQTRGKVRRALADVWPERAADPFDAAFLAELNERLQAAHVWTQVAAVYQRLALPELTPKDAIAGQRALQTLSRLTALAATLRQSATTLIDLGLSLPSSQASCPAFFAAARLRGEQLAALDALRDHVAPLLPRFPWLEDASAQACRSLIERLRQDGAALREIDGWFTLVDELGAQCRGMLDRVIESISGGSTADCRECIARSWAAAHLRAAQERWPALADHGTGLEDQRLAHAAQTLQRGEPQLRDLEVEAIAHALEQAELLRTRVAEYRARRTPAQKAKEAILKEVGKKSRLMPLRRFVREFSSTGLLDVLPCWLLSPETMVVLFPRTPLFDLVIFDEASQCTVESGLPVMLRARRVVIAGDEKQMPPTSFFKLGGEHTDEEDRSEQELRTRDAFAAESLLALARTRCAHAGLTWHYRCREEELIAYSNHSMYDGGLLTIPSTRSPAAPAALRWVHVEEGCYDAGLNRPEAERVVTLLGELLGRASRPTVGVITFNLVQRRTILDAIDRRVADDATFAERWLAASEVAALDERPFVKNLESVQGDERDVIVFSLGHAPVERRRKGGTSERYVPARFGPLGQRGGERRLNVAISRAKLECYVVASFDPSLLHVGHSTHAGPRLFKGFLEYAHALAHGRRLQANRTLDDVRGTVAKSQRRGIARAVDGYVPLATQIALALESEDLHCELDLGSSSFRIPLAIGRKGEPGFRLAVLADEGIVPTSAFERHVHRPNVLALRGWKVMHVTSTTWARRRSDVLEEIRRQIAASTPPA